MAVRKKFGECSMDEARGWLNRNHLEVIKWWSSLTKDTMMAVTNRKTEAGALAVWEGWNWRDRRSAMLRQTKKNKESGVRSRISYYDVMPIDYHIYADK